MKIRPGRAVTPAGVRAAPGAALIASLALVIMPADAAASSQASAPRDGFYAPLASKNATTVNDDQHHSASVNLSVIDNGTRVADTSRYRIGLSCVQDAAEVAKGLNPGASYLNVYVPPGRDLKIKGLTFSYSGPAYLTPDEIPSGASQSPGTIKINGKFTPATKITGSTVNNKVAAVTGTVSATLCPTAHPTFTDFWSLTD